MPHDMNRAIYLVEHIAGKGRVFVVLAQVTSTGFLVRGLNARTKEEVDAEGSDLKVALTNVASKLLALPAGTGQDQFYFQVLF